MRKEFEKLPEIAAELENSDGEIYWCDKQNQYRNNRVFQDSQTGWMNGAWYAWQAAKAQAVPEGYCVVPIESLEESLNWAGVAKWDSPNSAIDEEINKHEEIIRAIVEAQEQNQ